ncbi:hypothetical protein [Bradyrhizobium sp.]|jgi:hypothetical protein|uniref:hypothetical protein n=1 Tax=Bradyrhizobium sp. TaxID=376 RepID=UPI002DDCC9CD|nr:hypothetical protein [Bradyrhizobium sp.]HEV2155462.1 hypothetical protein [Bradyrhizobium sp.]
MTINEQQLKAILLAGIKDQFDYVRQRISDEFEPMPDHYTLDTPDFDFARFAAFVLASERNAPIDDLVGVVMKNSGGSANPDTVRKVILALRGERVSFVELPNGGLRPTE